MGLRLPLKSMRIVLPLAIRIAICPSCSGCMWRRQGEGCRTWTARPGFAEQHDPCGSPPICLWSNRRNILPVVRKGAPRSPVSQYRPTAFVTAASPAPFQGLLIPATSASLLPPLFTVCFTILPIPLPRLLTVCFTILPLALPRLLRVSSRYFRAHSRFLSRSFSRFSS